MNTYQNPLRPGADPFILAHDGKYYLYFTGYFCDIPDGYKVFVSDDMSSWEDGGYCLRKEDVMGDFGFWAPEITEKDGKFYMVYTSEEHLGIAVADSPMGPFKQTEKKWLSEKKTIDGHFFVDDDGTTYLYYVRLGQGNRIFAAKMSEDLMTLDEENEVLLIFAEEEWELRQSRVTEGPFVLKHNGKYYLTYSANHTKSPDYAVGYAVSDKPLGPFKKFAGNPILKRNEFVNGPGHHSFTVSKNGGELVCVYHTHHSLDEFVPRMVCVDRAEFIKAEDGGDDVLTVHGPTVTPQPAF